MPKPYIDQSTNEQNQKEFSIHGLSEAQFRVIQFILKWFRRNHNNVVQDGLFDLMVNHVISKEESNKIEQATNGVHVIIDHVIK